MDSRLEIEFDDFLHCESYHAMVEYRYFGKWQSKFPSGVWHVDVQAIPEFFEKVKNHNDSQYTIVSSQNDYGVAYQEIFPPWKDLAKWVDLMATPDLGYDLVEVEPRVKIKNCKETDKYSVRSYSFTSNTFDYIPECIKKWYSVNCHITDNPKLIGIPFGLNVNNNDKTGIKAIFEHKSKAVRDKLLYVNFSYNTADRYKLSKFYKLYDFATVKHKIKNDEYLDDMASHQFCLCPAGNGTDSYRIWEALYMGCVPIVEINEVTHHLLTLNLPILGVHTLFALPVPELIKIYEYLQSKWHLYDWKKLKESYWRKVIRGYNE